MSFYDHIYLNFIQDNRYLYLLNGLKVTLIVAFFAALLGVVLGLIAALFKIAGSENKKLRVLSVIAEIYTTLIRGTPVMIQILIAYFVVFASVDISKTLVGIAAFGINSGAYVCEYIRAGILSVDRGQEEAGRSLGFGAGQCYRYIILPQAIKNILPALGNEFISLLKETAVIGYIAVQDLTMAGNIIRSQTFDAFVPLLTAALIYLIIVMGMTWALRRLERRLRRSDQR